TKLYDSLVAPVIEYGASIWGTREFTCINAIHNRACRYYMGLGKYTPNLAVTGDMGWKPPTVRQWNRVFNQWNRCLTMDPNRINKKIFNWAYTCARGNCNNWSKRIFNQSAVLNIHDFRRDIIPIFAFDKAIVDNALAHKFLEKWHSNLFDDRNGINGGNKLRTYRLFKTRYEPEHYLLSNLNFQYRSAFAKFRCGVAPLRIETGRYEHIPLELRVCLHCSYYAGVHIIESEMHVLMSCPLYEDLREELFAHARVNVPNFDSFNQQDQFCIFFKNEDIIKYSAKTCHNILSRRRRFLYNL
ncbi:MAG: hypothetical protein ABW185_23135, partial [Sedimenticola sp.]